MAPQVTIRQRIGAAAVFLLVSGIFVFLWAGSAGKVNMSSLFGVCGFKQSYSLPCPGCYITTAAEAFVRGRILQSFYIQPGGAALCVILVVAGLTALLIACFGVNFGFLHRRVSLRMVKYIVFSMLIILAGGWAVTLARAIAQAGKN